MLDADLRKAIAAAAIVEHAIWFAAASPVVRKGQVVQVPAGTLAQPEDTDARFGDLVRYWLAGAHATIRPGTLEAVQRAVLDPTVAAAYTNLTSATLNAAIAKLAAAEKTVAAAMADCYRKWDAADLARPQLAAARLAVKAAKAEKDAAWRRLKKVANRPSTTAASQAALQSAEADLATATQALTTAQVALSIASGPDNDRAAAKRAYDTASAVSEALRKDKRNWEVPGKPGMRKAVLNATASTDKQAISTLVEDALQLAHQSRADKEPWSAVFVGSCVRTAALATGLEAIDKGGRHRGQNVPLEMSQKHAKYIVRARARAKRLEPGGYHAFEPTVRVVQIGDIICTDRKPFIDQQERKALKDVAEGDILHGDIVTRIEAPNGKPEYAEAIGGNVTQSVRRRRYPLDASGHLTVSKGVLFAEEKDDGTFAPFKTVSAAPTRLQPASTQRIFALLSLVEECKSQAATPPTQKAKAGKQERFGSESLDRLESPLLDGELFPAEPEDEWSARVAALVAASPFTQVLELYGRRSSLSMSSCGMHARETDR